MSKKVPLRRTKSNDDKLFRKGLTWDDYAVLRASMFELSNPPEAFVRDFIKRRPYALVGKLLEKGIDLEEFYLDSPNLSRGSSPRWWSMRTLNLTKEDLRTGLPAMYALKSHHKDSLTSTSTTSLPTDSDNVADPLSSEQSGKRERESSPDMECESSENMQDEPSTSQQGDEKERQLSKKKK